MKVINVILNPTELPSVKVLGSRVHLPDVRDVVSLMSHWIDNYQNHKKCRQIIVTGFHGLWEAHKDKGFKAMLNAGDLWIPDGIAPVWIARMKGVRHIDRVPGAEIMSAFFELANEKGYSSFFYGDTEETLAALRGNIHKKYPKLRIAGTYSPPFRELLPDEEAEHVRIINDAGPDVLWVGLGLPKQERWIYRNLDRLNVPVAIGVGACFVFFGGKVRRAPEWIGRLGFEWIWRLIQEPKKLWRRDLLDVPRFALHVVLELTGLRKYD